MILAKSMQENKDFYEVLDYYLELIRKIHIRTYDYLGNMRASTNPLAYCQGGFYGGTLNPNDKIKPLLKQATASFGVTALNELQRLYNGKSITEDGMFAWTVMNYINNKIKLFKKEDGNLYAVYGTPAENLCFDGDTDVQTYGGNKKIKDIIQGDLVYSFNENSHKIELKKVVESKLTTKNAVVVRVEFDNGQYVVCTENHPFAVKKNNRDESGRFFEGEHIEYVEASKLNPGDRIKSNYIHINPHGRPECSIYHNGKKQLIQDINAEYVYGEKPIGYVTHHEDEDKTNNRFENISYMTDRSHRILHMKDTIERFQYTSESQSGSSNSFYGKKHSQHSILKSRLSHIKNKIIMLDKNYSFICEYNCIEDAVKDGFTRSLIKKSCDTIGDYVYKSKRWVYEKDRNLVEKNHKIVSVEILSSLRDVYNIEVEDNNNFFVGGDKGILVHNCGLQVQQFRQKYGIIDGVSDRDYVSNSFHCHVTEDITPIEKQDSENRFWNLFEGGRIQYVKYPIEYNMEAIKTLIRRAMKLGFYEGVNLSLAYCDDCGHEELNMDTCPKCGSKNLTMISRMNGYLSYSRINGDTRLNDAKMIEISERKSM